MLNKIQQDKEIKMKQKNLELLGRIKKLERKKRLMAGQPVSDEDDNDNTLDRQIQPQY